MAKNTVGSLMATMGVNDEKRVRNWINAHDVKPRLDINKRDPEEAVHWIPIFRLIGERGKLELRKGRYIQYLRSVIDRRVQELVDSRRKRKQS